MLDENNQAPYFLETEYHGYVSEASPVGATVALDPGLSGPLALVALDNDVEEVRAILLITYFFFKNYVKLFNFLSASVVGK